MEKFVARLMDPLSGIVYLVFRVMAGGFMAQHGSQKALGWFGGFRGTDEPVDFSALPQLAVGGWIELVGGAMIALGLFTRSAAFLLSGTMAVAYFQFHLIGSWEEDGFTWPINNGELAVVYCFIYLLIAVRGTGRWGLTGRSKN